MNIEISNKRHSSICTHENKSSFMSPVKRGNDSYSYRMNIKSNSLFAYQEFDRFSSFLETPQNVNIATPSSFYQGSNSESNMSNSSSKSRSSSEGNSLHRRVKNFSMISDGYGTNPLVMNNYLRCISEQRKLEFNECSRKSYNFTSNYYYGKEINVSPFYLDRNFTSCFPFGTIGQNCNDNKCINELLCEQNTCRRVQLQLEDNKENKEYISKFYYSIEGYLIRILNHKFGNYLIQKLFEILIYQRNIQIISSFFNIIFKDAFAISIHPFGTRVIQKILELLDNDIYSSIECNDLNMFIRELVVNHFIQLSNDKNGNHVLQKIIRVFPKMRNEFIYTQIYNHAKEVSQLKQGVSILQALVKKGNQNQNANIAKSLVNNIDTLINDEYGNYAIQFVITDIQNENYTTIIYDYIKANIIRLYKNKFSSNVIDKCIVYEDTNSNKLIQFIIDNKLIREMITNQYGNYIVQKALNVSNGNILREIIKQIHPVIEELKESEIGRKIYIHLVKKYGKYFKE